MKPCEHSAFVHYGPIRLCYWCAEILSNPWTAQWTCDPSIPNPTPRDEVDAFIATLKGVAR